MPPDALTILANLNQRLADLPPDEAIAACGAYLLASEVIKNPRADVWLTLFWPDHGPASQTMRVRLHWQDVQFSHWCVDTPFTALPMLQRPEPPC